MSRDYAANVVASSFIKQYYEMMTKTPENLYKFYSEDSNFMHSDHNETKTATGPDAIRSAIAGLGLKNAKVDLSNGFVDAQKSANNGVLVSVMGILTTSDDKPGKPFAQSFLLSCQASTSYFVSNSIFRLLVSPEEHELVNLGGAASAATVAAAAAAAVVIATPAAAVIASHAPAHPAPAADATHGGAHATSPTAASHAHHSPSHASAGAAHHAPAPHQAPAPVAELATPEPATEEVQEEAEEEESEEPAASNNAGTATASSAEPNKKLNYSDIVRKQAAAAASAAPAGLPVKRVVKAAEKPAAASTSTPTASSSSSATKEGKNGNNDGTAVHAAYVRSLPEQTTVQDLRDLFSQFGTINQIDHLPGRVYAFVKFADASALQAALAFSGPLQLHGKTVSVEERSSSKGGPREGDKGGTPKSAGEGNKGPRREGERRGDGGNRGGDAKKGDRDNKQGDKKGDGDKRNSFNKAKAAGKA